MVEAVQRVTLLLALVVLVEALVQMVLHQVLVEVEQWAKVMQVVLVEVKEPAAVERVLLALVLVMVVTEYKTLIEQAQMFTTLVAEVVAAMEAGLQAALVAEVVEARLVVTHKEPMDLAAEVVVLVVSLMAK